METRNRPNTRFSGSRGPATLPNRKGDEIVQLSDEMVKKQFIVTLTGSYLESLNRLVEEGIYLRHQDAIRDALRRLFQYHGIEQFTDKGAELETAHA